MNRLVYNLSLCGLVLINYFSFKFTSNMGTFVSFKLFSLLFSYSVLTTLIFFRLRFLRMSYWFIICPFFSFISSYEVIFFIFGVEGGNDIKSELFVVGSLIQLLLGLGVVYLALRKKTRQKPR